jgi:hypothetical protein
MFLQSGPSSHALYNNARLLTICSTFRQWLSFVPWVPHFNNQHDAFSHTTGRQVAEGQKSGCSTKQENGCLGESGIVPTIVTCPARDAAQLYVAVLGVQLKLFHLMNEVSLSSLHVVGRRSSTLHTCKGAA